MIPRVLFCLMTVILYHVYLLESDTNDANKQEFSAKLVHYMWMHNSIHIVE